VEEMKADNNPEDESAGTRLVKFARTLYVEKEDFREEAHKKWYRFAPGKEVRLKHAYYVTCNEVLRNDAGEVIELRCTYDPDSRGGWTNDGRKVRGTLHWVAAEHCVDAEVRHYDHLVKEDADRNAPFSEQLNPDSLKVLTGCKAEVALTESKPGEGLQFLRHGYYTVDSEDSTSEKMVFNRTVTLRDSWAKIEKKLNS
jgi:glutaminyl-tRNA synthetase